MPGPWGKLKPLADNSGRNEAVLGMGEWGLVTLEYAEVDRLHHRPVDVLDSTLDGRDVSPRIRAIYARVGYRQNLEQEAETEHAHVLVIIRTWNRKHRLSMRMCWLSSGPGTGSAD